MSKKMWNKIFKSKSQKPQQPLAKINKRHSRGIYEEYQQLNDLLAGEKAQLNFSDQGQNEKENEHGNGNGNGCGNGNGSINVFEQQPRQSSFNSLEFSEAHQQQLLQQQQYQQSSQQQHQQQQQLSTFSRVRNTFSLRRGNNKKQLLNAKSTTNTATMDSGVEDSMQGADTDPLPPPPPPLTTGSPLPIPEHAPPQSSGDLTPCPCCSRTFNLDALRKHIVICEKTSKKRKVFDSSRQRRDGTALSTYVLPKNFGLPNAERTVGVPVPPAPVSTAAVAAPAEPQNFPRSTARASMRKAASTLSNSSSTETPPAAPVAPAPPTVRERSQAKRIKAPACDRCPHCERTFNPKAFDRHVEWCKEKAIQANMKSGNSQETSKAKERLEARKQYKPPNLKTKRSLARDKYSGNHEELLEAGDMSAPKPNIMSLSMTSSVHSDNGLGDKYDPFLSAKRQLEELCSPSTPPPEEEVTTIRSLMTPTATATPSIAMTTSLTSTGSTKPVQIASKTTTPTSNFRRTSSLRGPRRNAPLLNSRPLFATNYRPTIQRGLSDEGPISTNFLKPEEYDEMPVRAACGNDFHSPRVVRRDTSASNRKQPLKLPVSGTNEGGNTTSSVQPTRTVAKTDSLAVFLKYEHELEQLNAKAAELATASQLNSKELKDKSNTLSKQNSAKNLGQSTPTQLPPLTPTGAVPPSPTLAKENHYPPIATPLRLEPISNKPAMIMNQQPPPLTPIKLESIFGPRRELGSVSGAGSVAGDYIDPKLINACDNLHVNSGISSDASSTPQQLSQSRSRSSSQSTITHERRQSGEARNLLKRKMRLGRNQFLYDASPEDADASSGCCSADDEANRSSMEYDEQCWQQQQKQLLANPLPLVMPMVHSAMPTFDDFDFEEFLSSFENENDDEQFPLFKDCREFLLNRSTSRHRSFQKAATSTPQTATPQINPQLHGHQSKSKDNYAHATHRSDANTSSQSQPEERLQRQQSNASRGHEEKQSRFQELERRADAEDQQKREIFISIETEANAQGRSPISPESLRHMVGNPQTPIDVLHIENGNEPEHARFSKISDTEDAGQEPGDRASQLGSNTNTNRLAPSLSASTLAPNVQLNNAKNLMQQMQSDFRQLGEEASASVRRQLMLNSGRSEEHQQQQFRNQETGQQEQQHQHQHQQQQHAPLTPSPSADSDELSSLDGYPMSSSQSSRRGASSKLSSDSAYGSSNSPYSLSRQRSSELQPIGGTTHRSQGLLRPHTASAKLPSTTSDACTQAQTQYGTLKARQRLFGNGGSVSGGGNGNGEGVECSSSGSEDSSQQPIQQQQQQQQASNYNYQQQQQQQHQLSQPAYNNNNLPMTPTISQHSLLSNNSNNSMSSSMKMSKFCHECGAKFIIEHAKFCMDCGVRRMVL
ncbi:uncharacterized protein [Drosophila kikkawai]|uniref:Uncharacterized protein isoform X2 n=1 Tax=Drosophila kikkawai TaxID=30033 RepID=A0A6P4IPZ5_DROKI|nr:uncharacterized protein LOC108076293 isoform X1 [Drosophila kikkawai]